MKGCLICLLTFVLAGELVAQSGTITGRIFDRSNGDPLPGANVLIVDTRLGAAASTDGRFVIPRVPPGNYALKVQMIGYAPALRQNLRIMPGDTIRLTIGLQPTTIDMPAVVVSATKKAGSLIETPASVSILSEQFVRRQNVLSVEDALEFAPGVHLMDSQINIRGSSGYSRGAGSRVVLLIDGIPMLPGDSGDIKWDTIPVDEIARVEVVKGAASALYGSSAIGGVVNIITREPEEQPTTKIRLTGGVYDKPYSRLWRWTGRTQVFHEQDFSHTRTIGRLGLKLSATRRESEGYKESGQYLRYTFYGKARYHFSPASSVLGYLNYATNVNGAALFWQDYFHTFLADPASVDNTIYSTKLQAGALVTQVFSSRAVSRTRIGLYRNTWENRFVDNNDHVTAVKTDVDWQLDYTLNPRYTFTFGATVTYDNVTSTIYEDHHTWDLAAYTQHEWDGPADLQLNAGVRYDYHWVDSGLTEYQLTPKFALVYAPVPYLSARLVSGTGFRSATIAEMFTSTTTSGFQVIPNLDLVAETAWSNEIGFQAILPFAFVNVAGFWNEYNDFIEADFIEAEGGQVIQFQNINRARIRGAEIELRTELLEKLLSFQAGYTYMDARDLELGTALAYRPRHLVTVSGNLHWRALRLGADFRYASRLDTVKIFPEDPRVSQKLTNVRVGMAWRALEVMFNINNLFNYQYTQIERNMEPLRNYSLTVRTRF